MASVNWSWPSDENKNKIKPIAKSSKPKTPDAMPKKPQSSYFLFSKQRRKELENTFPNKTVVDISKLISSEWKHLSYDARKVYENDYEINKKMYKDDLEKYQKTDEYKQYKKDIDNWKQSTIIELNKIKPNTNVNTNNPFSLKKIDEQATIKPNPNTNTSFSLNSTKISQKNDEKQEEKYTAHALQNITFSDISLSARINKNASTLCFGFIHEIETLIFDSDDDRIIPAPIFQIILAFYPSEIPFYDYIFNIQVIGDYKVGKTTLCNIKERVCKVYIKDDGDDGKDRDGGGGGGGASATPIRKTPRSWSDRYINDNNKIVLLKMYDVESLDLFTNTHQNQPSKNYWGDCIIIMFDISNRDSFTNLSRLCLGSNQNNIILILVGNKCDIDKDNRKVSNSEAVDYAARGGIEYIEISNKDNINIDKLFELVSNKIINKYNDNHKQFLNQWKDYKQDTFGYGAGWRFNGADKPQLSTNIGTKEYYKNNDFKAFKQSDPHRTDRVYYYQNICMSNPIFQGKSPEELYFEDKYNQHAVQLNDQDKIIPTQATNASHVFNNKKPKFFFDGTGKYQTDNKENDDQEDEKKDSWNPWNTNAVSSGFGSGFGITNNNTNAFGSGFGTTHPVTNTGAFGSTSIRSTTNNQTTWSFGGSNNNSSNNTSSGFGGNNNAVSSGFGVGFGTNNSNSNSNTRSGFGLSFGSANSNPTKSNPSNSNNIISAGGWVWPVNTDNNNNNPFADVGPSSDTFDKQKDKSIPVLRAQSLFSNDDNKDKNVVVPLQSASNDDNKDENELLNVSKLKISDLQKQIEIIKTERDKYKNELKHNKFGKNSNKFNQKSTNNSNLNNSSQFGSNWNIDQKNDDNNDDKIWNEINIMKQEIKSLKFKVIQLQSNNNNNNNNIDNIKLLKQIELLKAENKYLKLKMEFDNYNENDVNKQQSISQSQNDNNIPSENINTAYSMLFGQPDDNNIDT